MTPRKIEFDRAHGRHNAITRWRLKHWGDCDHLITMSREHPPEGYRVGEIHWSNKSGQTMDLTIILRQVDRRCPKLDEAALIQYYDPPV